MKKLTVIILSTLLVMFTAVCYGQNGFVFDDAVTILNGDQGQITNIIAYYANRPEAKKDEVNSIIRANPLLNQSDVLKKYISTTQLLDSAETAEFTGGASGLFGLNVTNFADGLAKFLIERGKQELSMAFFDKMKEEFNKYPELKILFPLTFEILDEIENHNILTLLQELKDAFAKDLVNGPTNLLALRYIENVDCSMYEKDKEKKHCEEHNKIIQQIRNAAWTQAASFSLHIAQGIVNGSNIIAILGNVATDTTFCESSDNVSGVVKLSYALMDMLRASKESDGLFINESRLRELFSNQELLTIFLGLGYEKYKTLECFKPDQLKIGTVGLDGIFQRVLEARTKFFGKISSFDNLNVSYNSLKKQLTAGSSVEINNYRTFVSASTLAVGRIASGFSVVLKIEDAPELKKLLENIDITADFVVDIHQKNYAGIFNGIIRFIDTNNVVDNTDAKAKVVKYLSFGANIASAQNSDEVKNALNAATLPPGSFSVKQKSKFSIGVNAYVGYAWDFKDGLYGRNVYAPLGIASSWGLNKGNAGAVSLFISVIDVGSLVAYRLNNSATDTLKQEVRLESIISPSAQVIYALPRLPLSICAGVRRTPKLVFEGQTEFRVVKPETVFNLSILIDIPLFNLKVTPHD